MTESDRKPQKETEEDFPFMSHLVELRNRLLWCVVAIIAAFFVCYYFAPQIFEFLAAPLNDVMKEKGASQRLIATGLTEPFFAYVKVSFWAACFLAFPFIAVQIWAFVAPGLYKHEQKAFFPFLVATPILFLLGASMVYYLIFPLAWDFFLSFETPASDQALPIEFEARMSEYLSLVMTLIFAFGISFQLPVLLTLLARVGIVSSVSLAEKRKYAVLAVFVVAAILTPPDPISQLSLALPLLVLYEASIWTARLMEHGKEEEADLYDLEDQEEEIKKDDVKNTSPQDEYHPPAP